MQDSFTRILNRPPSSDEQATCASFLSEQAQRLSAANLSPFTAGPAATVFNDGDRDELTGDSGRDWFFGHRKDDRQSNEVLILTDLS